MEGKNIFDKPPEDTDLAEENKRRIDLTLHNADLYNQEGDGHGGEKVDPETGRPNVDKNDQPIPSDEIVLSERSIKGGGKDIMGDIKDPSKMSLEELLASDPDK